jgi:hypothetical protein
MYNLNEKIMDNTTNNNAGENQNQGGGAKIWDDQNIADRGASEDATDQESRNTAPDTNVSDSKFDGQNSGDKNGGMDKTKLDITD